MKRSTMERRHLPGQVVEIRYDRNGTYYRHPFKPGVRQQINPDGSITLYHPSRRIWADDQTPGFWERYGDRHPRNPGGSMARGGPNWLMWALLAGGAYFLFMRPSTGSTGGAAPVAYWIAPTGDLATITYAPGITPPHPSWRPASEYELSQMAPM